MLTRLLFLLALIPITLWGEPAVEARIRASLEQEVKPVIFVDLDATLFSEAARVREVLEAYDSQHGTKIFANANWSELSTFSGFETTLDKHLAKATPDAASLAATKKAILAFEHDRRFHPESIRKDQVYTPLKKAIETWETAGAKIVFLTGRDHRVRKVTQEKLAAEGLGRFGLLTKEPDTLTAAFKGDSVTAYQKANPKEKVIALVDDATENLQVVHELHPDVLSLTTTQKNPTTLELEDPLASPTFVTIERYARNYAKWKYAFIPSRLKVHADILAQISGTVGPSPKPLVLFTSGSFGSGKSTVIERLVNSQLIQADHFAWIDPDDIRERVPEYQKFKAVDPKNAGSLVHLEVGLIQEALFESALKGSQNIIMEGTLRSAEWNQAEFARIRKMYPQYRIGIIALKADEAVAQKRVMERAQKEGRDIPPSYVAQIAKEVPETLKVLEPLVDFTVEVENTDKPMVTRIRVGAVQQPYQSELPIGPPERLDTALRQVRRLLSPRLTGTGECLEPLGSVPN